MKLAAIEGTGRRRARRAAGALRAGPTRQAEKNRYEIAIPKLGSLILTHDLGRRRPRASRTCRPTCGRRSRRCSSAFRVMVGIGLRCSRSALWSLWLRWRGAAVRRTAGFSARAHADDAGGLRRRPAGWFTTEIGRQPYVVYGLLRTRRRGLADRRAARCSPRSSLFASSTPSSSASAPTTSRSSCARAGAARGRCAAPRRPAKKRDSVRSRCRTRASTAARPPRTGSPIRRRGMFGFGTEYEGLAFWLPLIWAWLIAFARGRCTSSSTASTSASASSSRSPRDETGATA